MAGPREWIWSSGDVSRDSVRVALRGDSVLVSKVGDVEERTLVFSAAEWSAFVEGARRGEFDLVDGRFSDGGTQR